MVIFCGMSDLQRKIYKSFIRSKAVSRLFMAHSDSSPINNALAFIQSLKRLLTHPNMIYDMIQERSSSDDEESVAWKDALKLFPEGYDSREALDERHSAKMTLLVELLKKIKEQGDRIVVVSNFTSILDEIEKLCDKEYFSHVRLDGSTSSEKRMQIVDSYNSPSSKDFVFLLSSKAGGCGLNLIGANRLILFDPDWVRVPFNSDDAIECRELNVFFFFL